MAKTIDAESLRKPLARFRAAPARGIQEQEAAQVDRRGGDNRAGLIRGMAVVTRGEALGHGHWCDAEFLKSVAAAMQESESGVKARFTHPDLSGDGLGKFLGRAKGGEIDGDVVRGDLHFSKTAHETPDGDLAEYVMDLAEEDPHAFGTSIVFERDRAAEVAFRDEHSDVLADEDGYFYQVFKSPDSDNQRNLPHVRLKRLWAVDAVDEPAANPGGLFHRPNELLADGERLLTYALGLSTEAPVSAALDVDPDRLAAFVARFLDRHGLSLVPVSKERIMKLKTISPSVMQALRDRGLIDGETKREFALGALLGFYTARGEDVPEDDVEICQDLAAKTGDVAPDEEPEEVVEPEKAEQAKPKESGDETGDKPVEQAASPPAAPPAQVPPDEAAKEETAIEQAVRQERKRCTEVVALCAEAGLGDDTARQFLREGTEIPDVQSACIKHLAKRNPPVGDGGGNDVQQATDPTTQAKQEYAANRKRYKGMGVSEDEYVKSRVKELEDQE